MKRRVDDHNKKSLNNSNNNVLRWIQTKVNKLLGNHKRVGNHPSVEFIDVPIIHKPHQSNRSAGGNSNREKLDSMMRILRSPIAFGYFQAYLTNEEESKCQYLKFYLACKDLTERHQNFINTQSNGSGQLELFQFRQKARVMNIWQTFLENNGDDGCAIYRHTSELVTQSEQATSPFAAYDEEGSKSSASQLQDIPAEEISRPTPTRTPVRMAVAMHNISRPQSRKHNKNGGHGPSTTHTIASKQFNTPYVVSNSDKGPSKRIVSPPVPVIEHHTFLPTKVVRNVRFNMDNPAEGTWAPDIFTEVCDSNRFSVA